MIDITPEVYNARRIDGWYSFEITEASSDRRLHIDSDHPEAYDLVVFFNHDNGDYDAVALTDEEAELLRDVLDLWLTNHS